MLDFPIDRAHRPEPHLFTCNIKLGMGHSTPNIYELKMS